MLSESQAADLEELAAFIDGRLSGERKARVEERLLRDEDYYEIYLETVQFQGIPPSGGIPVSGRIRLSGPNTSTGRRRQGPSRRTDWTRVANRGAVNPDSLARRGSRMRVPGFGVPGSAHRTRSPGIPRRHRDGSDDPE